MTPPARRPRPGLAVLSWTLTLAYAGLIYHLSSLSRPVPFFESMMKYHTDLLLHGVEYGVLGWLLLGSLTLSFPTLSRRTLVTLAFAGCLLYAVSDEWHQSFVPGRDSSAMDLAADAAGGLLGSVARDLTLRRKRPYALHQTV